MITRQPPIGGKDDCDSEDSWISDGLPSSSRRRRRGNGRATVRQLPMGVLVSTKLMMPYMWSQVPTVWQPQMCVEVRSSQPRVLPPPRLQVPTVRLSPMCVSLSFQLMVVSNPLASLRTLRTWPSAECNFPSQPFARCLGSSRPAILISSEFHVSCSS